MYPLPLEELKETTWQLAAENVLRVVADMGTSPAQRLRAIGDYMMCCALTCEQAGLAGWEQRYTAGFVHLGIPEPTFNKLLKLMRNEHLRSMVFSLSYLPDKPLQGITRTKRKIELRDETEFLRGVLERAA